MPVATIDSPVPKLFRAEYAVPMHCESCAADVTAAVQSVVSDSRSLKTIQPDLTNQTVLIESSLSPSAILSAIRATGRSAIFRGASGTDPASHPAAVCIFESFRGAMTVGAWAQHDNRGVARLLQIDDEHCLVDLTVDVEVPEEFADSSVEFAVKVHELGDISDGAESTGDVFKLIGTFVAEPTTGKGLRRAQLVTESSSLNVWDVLGRSLVIDLAASADSSASQYSMCGVIARSAGLFENTKKVCSCSGQTLWEESSTPRL
ncbi:superoxide dismutase [Cladochytrium replicatum]|nr:superoxide dismutase [Cladochytrium replicatum]